MLATSSVAAALALLLVFTVPQIVQAATQLYQRLFGQVVSDIEAEQAAGGRKAQGDGRGF